MSEPQQSCPTRTEVDDDCRRDAEAVRLDVLQASYVATDNPLYAWGAYTLCRTRGMPLPEWVAAYFDGVAARLFRLVASPPDEDVSSAAGVAMGFPKGPKGRSYFRQAQDAERDAWCCSAFLALRRQGKSRAAAWKEICESPHRPKGMNTARTVQNRVEARLHGFAHSLDDFENLPETDDGPLLLALIAPDWDRAPLMKNSPEPFT